MFLVRLGPLPEIAKFRVWKPETLGFQKSPPPLPAPQKPPSRFLRTLPPPCMGMYGSAYYYEETCRPCKVPGGGMGGFGGGSGWQFMKTKTESNRMHCRADFWSDFWDSEKFRGYWSKLLRSCPKMCCVWWLPHQGNFWEVRGQLLKISLKTPRRLLRRSFIRSPCGGYCFSQSPPKGAGKLVPRENCRKYFWHFLTIFDVFCPARKLSKSVENIFDTFWRFLTVFDVAPFRWPLVRSAGFLHLRKPGVS